MSSLLLRTPKIWQSSHMSGFIEEKFSSFQVCNIGIIHNINRFTKKLLVEEPHSLTKFTHQYSHRNFSSLSLRTKHHTFWQISWMFFFFKFCWIHNILTDYAFTGNFTVFVLKFNPKSQSFKQITLGSCKLIWCGLLIRRIVLNNKT